MNLHSKILFKSILLLMVLNWAGCAAAQQVIRGPYLQMPTQNGIVIKWRTDVPTDSAVRYGLSADTLSQTESSGALTTEHQITLGSLSANTQYFYSVGTTGAALKGTENYFFVTPPLPGTDKATRIWVTGDAGTADGYAASVRDHYKAFAGSRPTDLWLMLGDIAYTHGTDAQYQAAFFDMYPELLKQTPSWPTFGNHDGLSADSQTQTGPYYDIFSLPTAAEIGGAASLTEAYYSFDYGNIHFISLDSFDSDRTAGGSMLTWLMNDLSTNTRQWTIAFWHHPPYSNGSHNSDAEPELIEMRENVVGVLETYGVDLVLSGHSHSYERSYLLNGHYGDSTTLTAGMILDAGSGREDDTGAYVKPGVAGTPNDGAVYAVAGSSGKIGAAGLNHPAMYISLLKRGSMVLDVSGNRLEAKFLDDSGSQLDHFTVIKGSDNFSPTIAFVEPTGDTAISVLFSEPVDPVTAQTPGNYSLSGLTISAATLLADQRSLQLTTATQTPGTDYTLTINNVEDLAGNAIANNTTALVAVPLPTLSLSFQNGVAPTGAYAGMIDTTLKEELPELNYGGNTHLLVDGDHPGGTGLDQSVLMRWDISQIPPDATILAARIEMEVSNSSPNLYKLFQIKRDWQATQATWNRFATNSTWTEPGAKGVDDRGQSELGMSVTTTNGNRTLPLNEAGVAMLQSWVDGSTPNYGFILADSQYTNNLDFHSSEIFEPTWRPKLIIDYRQAPEPLSLAVGWTPTPATKGVFYWWEGLTVSGGTPPYSWSLVGGWLPWPLTLNQDGVILGVPGNVTTAWFTVQVTDANSDIASASSSMSVNSPAYVCGSCHAGGNL